MEKIRLGYEEFLTLDGISIPAAWFFGRQGERVDFRCWSDFTYEDMKNSSRTVEVERYLAETGNLNCLAFFEEDLKFETGLYKDYIAGEQTFLVPILITSSYPERDLQYLLTALLPEDLRNYIKAGKATVLFFSHTEGNIDDRWFPILDAFCKNNGLDKKEAWLSISDLNRSKYPKYEDRRFSVRLFSYFSEELWFHGDDYRGSKIGNYSLYLQQISKYRKENRLYPKQKTILCLNRRRMPHRSFLAGYIASQPSILEKSWLSLGTAGIDGFTSDVPFTGKDAIECIGYLWDLGDREMLNSVREYYTSKYSENVLRQLDLPDLIMSENPKELNEDLYRTSFVNVISETYCDGRGYHFFTEKTFKCIYSMMPFIIANTCGALKSLRELGFQTFGDWWDESYDEIEDDRLRIQKICSIVKELCNKSTAELFDMTQSMEPVLWHNAMRLISYQDIEESLNFFISLQNRGLN